MRRLTIEVVGRAHPPPSAPHPGTPARQEYLTLPDLGALCRLLTPVRLALIECLMASGPLSLPELVQRTGLPAEQLGHELALLERHLLVEPTAQGWQVPYETIQVRMVISQAGVEDHPPDHG